MKYCVDRIEGEIAILENLTTNEIIEVSMEHLPKNVKETNILNLIDGIYTLDLIEEEQRRVNIQSKFDRLKKKRCE
jgi:hypothetical protein